MFLELCENGYQVLDDGRIEILNQNIWVCAEPKDSTFTLEVKSAEQGVDVAFKAAVRSLMLRSEQGPYFISWERLEEYMKRYRMGWTLRMLSTPVPSVQIIIH